MCVRLCLASEYPLTIESCRQPHQLSADNRRHVADCTEKQTFDYFSGSEISFVLSFSALVLVFFGEFSASCSASALSSSSSSVSAVCAHPVALFHYFVEITVVTYQKKEMQRLTAV